MPSGAAIPSSGSPPPAMGVAAPAGSWARQHAHRPPTRHFRGNSAHSPGEHLRTAGRLQPHRRGHPRLPRPGCLALTGPGEGCPSWPSLLLLPGPVFRASRGRGGATAARALHGGTLPSHEGIAANVSAPMAGRTPSYARPPQRRVRVRKPDNQAVQDRRCRPMAARRASLARGEGRPTRSRGITGTGISAAGALVRAPSAGPAVMA